MMLGGRKGDAGAALGALEELVALLVIAQKVVRGEDGAVAGGAEDGRHDAYRNTVVIYSLSQNCHFRHELAVRPVCWDHDRRGRLWLPATMFAESYPQTSGILELLY